MKETDRNRIVLTLLLSILLSVNAVAQKTYLVCVCVADNRNHEETRPNLIYDIRGIANFYHSYNNADVFMLVDANATRSHILRILKQQFAKSTSADEIIFAYSGHGFDGGVSTYNNGEVLYCSEVQQIMSSAKARRKIMYVNSCHSGSFSVDQMNDRRSRYNKNSNVLLFLSSRSNEYSYVPMYGERESFFYSHLLEALRGEADNNDDKKVTARELFNYVASNVASTSSGRQHPVMWGKFSDDMVIVYVK